MGPSDQNFWLCCFVCEVASFRVHQVSHLTLVYLSKELEDSCHVFLLHQVITFSYMYIHIIYTSKTFFLNGVCAKLYLRCG